MKARINTTGANKNTGGGKEIKVASTKRGKSRAPGYGPVGETTSVASGAFAAGGKAKNTTDSIKQ